MPGLMGIRGLQRKQRREERARAKGDFLRAEKIQDKQDKQKERLLAQGKITKEGAEILDPQTDTLPNLQANIIDTQLTQLNKEQPYYIKIHQQITAINDVRKQLRRIKNRQGVQWKNLLNAYRLALKNAQKTLEEQIRYDGKLQNKEFQQDIRNPEHLDQKLEEITVLLKRAKHIGSRALTNTSDQQSTTKPVRNTTSKKASQQTENKKTPQRVNSAKEAFDQKGVIGLLDHRGKTETSMTPGQRRGRKSFANLGLVAGGIFLGRKVVSNVFKIVTGNDEKEKRTGRLWGIGSLLTIAGVQATTGKNPRQALKEIFKGGDSAQRMSDFFFDDDSDAANDSNEELRKIIRPATAVASVLGAIPFQDIVDNQLLVQNGDQRRINYKKTKTYLEQATQAETIPAENTKKSLKALQKLENKRDQSFVTQGMKDMGITQATLETHPERNISHYYIKLVNQRGEEGVIEEIEDEQNNNEDNENNENNENDEQNNDAIQDNEDNDNQDDENGPEHTEEETDTITDTHNTAALLINTQLTTAQKNTLIRTRNNILTKHPESQMTYKVKGNTLRVQGYSNPTPLPINVNTRSIHNLQAQKAIPCKSLDGAIRSVHFLNFLREIHGAKGNASNPTPWSIAKPYNSMPRNHRGLYFDMDSDQDPTLQGLRDEQLYDFFDTKVIKRKQLKKQYPDLAASQGTFVGLLNKLPRRHPTPQNKKLREQAEAISSRIENIIASIKQSHNIQIVTTDKTWFVQDLLGTTRQYRQSPNNNEILKTLIIVEQQIQKRPAGKFKAGALGSIKIYIGKNIGETDPNRPEARYSVNKNNITLDVKTANKTYLEKNNLLAHVCNHELVHLIIKQLPERRHFEASRKKLIENYAGPDYYQGSERGRFGSPIEGNSNKPTKIGTITAYQLSNFNEDIAEIGATIITGGIAEKRMYELAQKDPLLQAKINLYKTHFTKHMGNTVPTPTPDQKEQDKQGKKEKEKKQPLITTLLPTRATAASTAYKIEYNQKHIGILQKFNKNSKLQLLTATTTPALFTQDSKTKHRMPNPQKINSYLEKQAQKVGKKATVGMIIPGPTYEHPSNKVTGAAIDNGIQTGSETKLTDQKSKNKGLVYIDQGKLHITHTQELTVHQQSQLMQKIITNKGDLTTLPSVKRPGKSINQDSKMRKHKHGAYLIEQTDGTHAIFTLSNGNHLNATQKQKLFEEMKNAKRVTYLDAQGNGHLDGYRASNAQGTIQYYHQDTDKTGPTQTIKKGNMPAVFVLYHEVDQPVT